MVQFTSRKETTEWYLIKETKTNHYNNIGTSPLPPLPPFFPSSAIESVWKMENLQNCFSAMINNFYVVTYYGMFGIFFYDM